MWKSCIYIHALGCQTERDMDSDLFTCLALVHLKYWRTRKNVTVQEMKGEYANKHNCLCRFVQQLRAMCATQ